MFSTDFIFRQQENLVDNQKCKAGFRPLCKKNTIEHKVTFLRLLTCLFRCNKTMHELHRRQYQAQPRFQPQPHSGFKSLKPAKSKFTSCGFTIFVMQICIISVSGDFLIIKISMNFINGNKKSSLHICFSHTVVING